MQSWESYESNLRHHILPALGKLGVAGLTTPDCEKATHGM